jgi:hypothetical protein
MDKIFAIIMIVLIAIACVFVVGAIQYDLDRMAQRDACTELGGIPVKGHYGKVICIDKNAIKTPISN